MANIKLDFRGWLNEAAGVSIRLLYHGTNTGPRGEVLDSFRRDGVRPMSGSGHGQGDGFYCFADFKTAAHHALTVSDEDSNVTTNAATGGRPMVVAVVAKLNPEDWDIDYEVHHSSITKHLHANLDKVVGQELDPVDGQRFRILSGKAMANPEGEEGVGLTYQRGIARGSRYSWSEPDVGSAQLLSRGMSGLRRAAPEGTEGFMTAFFDRLDKGWAVKYVGDRGLRVAEIKVHDGNEWVTA